MTIKYFDAISLYVPPGRDYAVRQYTRAPPALT